MSRASGRSSSGMEVLDHGVVRVGHHDFLGPGGQRALDGGVAFSAVMSRLVIMRCSGSSCSQLTMPATPSMSTEIKTFNSGPPCIVCRRGRDASPAAARGAAPSPRRQRSTKRATSSTGRACRRAVAARDRVRLKQRIQHGLLHRLPGGHKQFVDERMVVGQAVLAEPAPAAAPVPSRPPGGADLQTYAECDTRWKRR